MGILARVRAVGEIDGGVTIKRRAERPMALRAEAGENLRRTVALLSPDAPPVNEAGDCLPCPGCGRPVYDSSPSPNLIGGPVPVLGGRARRGPAPAPVRRREDGYGPWGGTRNGRKNGMTEATASELNERVPGRRWTVRRDAAGRSSAAVRVSSSRFSCAEQRLPSAAAGRAAAVAHLKARLRAAPGPRDEVYCACRAERCRTHLRPDEANAA
ncbi:hypothetical protein ACFXPY_12795 [Streptomyces sp. NPDC059153]|uniref:hypothetical protein n=1 Tax=Streptomyces sp. NPDC059153 TaxID=3346743 RepID=UPI0036CBC897